MCRRAPRPALLLPPLGTSLSCHTGRGGRVHGNRSAPLGRLKDARSTAAGQQGTSHRAGARGQGLLAQRPPGVRVPGPQGPGHRICWGGGLGGDGAPGAGRPPMQTRGDHAQGHQVGPTSTPFQHGCSAALCLGNFWFPRQGWGVTLEGTPARKQPLQGPSAPIAPRVLPGLPVPGLTGGCSGLWAEPVCTTPFCPAPVQTRPQQTKTRKPCGNGSRRVSLVWRKG